MSELPNGWTKSHANDLVYDFYIEIDSPRARAFFYSGGKKGRKNGSIFAKECKRS